MAFGPAFVLLQRDTADDSFDAVVVIKARNRSGASSYLSESSFNNIRRADGPPELLGN